MSNLTAEAQKVEARIVMLEEGLKELREKVRELPSREVVSDSRVGLPWTAREDYTLNSEFNYFVQSCAKLHGRSFGAISSRIKHYYESGRISS